MSFPSYGSINPTSPDPSASGSLKYTSIQDARGRVLEGPVIYAGRSCIATLYDDDTFACAQAGGRDLVRINCEDVVGVSVSSFAPMLVIHAYPVKGKGRELRDIHLSCADTAECERWASGIRCRAANVPVGAPLPPPRRVLLLVNPFGGTKQAPVVCQRIVRPLLERAGAEIEVISTTHAGHATEIGRTFSPTAYDAVGCVSGDGLLHELLQGIMSRPDWHRTVQVPLAIVPAGSGNGLAASIGCADPTAAAFVLAKGQPRPLDLMSVSQGGALVRMGFLSLTWAVISDIDIESEKFRFLGPLRFTLGALKAICQYKRYYGRLRYLPADDTLHASRQLAEHDPVTHASAHALCPRSCPLCMPVSAPIAVRSGGAAAAAGAGGASVSPVQPPRAARPSSGSLSATDSHSQLSSPSLDDGAGRPRPTGAPVPQHRRTASVTDTVAAPASPGASLSGHAAALYSTTPARLGATVAAAAAAAPSVAGGSAAAPAAAAAAGTGSPHVGPGHVSVHVDVPVLCLGPSLPDLPLQPDSEAWRTVEGDFVLFTAGNTACLSSDAKTAPYAHLSDGCVDLSWIVGDRLSRLGLLKLFLSADTGQHVPHPEIHYVKARAFILEPIAPLGIVDVDGEAIPSVPTRIDVHRGLGRLLVPFLRGQL